MIPTMYIPLIKSLIEKTNSGKSIWNRTSAQNQYRLILDSGMVVLTYKRDYTRGETIIMDIYDKEGIITDSVTVNSKIDDIDFVTLSNLFNSIHRIKEANTQKQINILMNEITSTDKIGKSE